MHRLFVIVIMSLLITGCGSKATQIILHNPETKQVVKCQGDPQLHSNPADAAEACAKGYEKAGYVRTSSN